MKRVGFVVLGLSCAVNAALVVALMGRLGSRAEMRGEASGIVTAATAATPERSPATVWIPAQAFDKSTWPKLASDDLATLVANLRAAGFPERITRAIVGAILGERFAARRKAILGGPENTPFWKTRSSSIARSKLADLRTLSREQADAMKQLFGSDPASDEARDNLRRLYGDLPSEKLDLVQRIQSDYGDLQTQIQMDAGGYLLPEDRENVALLEKERRADLAGVLSPEELAMFDLYSSPSAHILRSQLDGFNPTEQEFRALFALRRDFDQRFNTAALNPFDENLMRERQAAEQQMNDQIKATLGDARFLEFQRAQDSGYRVASKIAERYDLPPENANAVYDLQKDAQQRLAAVRGDRPALATLVRETNERLTTLLGPSGAEAYKDVAGSWLRSLERMNAAPAPDNPPHG